MFLSLLVATKFPDTNEYQVDFERNKYNDLFNEVKRFYKDFIQWRRSTIHYHYKDFEELYPFRYF